MKPPDGMTIRPDVPTHACPPIGSGIMPCCNRPPFEVRAHRMTLDPKRVTCGRNLAPFTVTLSLP